MDNAFANVDAGSEAIIRDGLKGGLAAGLIDKFLGELFNLEGGNSGLGGGD